MDNEPIPCFLSEREGRVSVLMLLGEGDQLAIYAEDRYKQIGQVVERKVTDRDRNGITRTRNLWQWYWDEPEYGKSSGHEPTKAKAVAALLSEGGYREVSDLLTIPPLF